MRRGWAGCWGACCAGQGQCRRVGDEGEFTVSLHVSIRVGIRVSVRAGSDSWTVGRPADSDGRSRHGLPARPLDLPAPTRGGQ